MTLMFTLAEAETKLAELVALTQQGEEVVIERDGAPLAILRAPAPASAPAKRKRRIGVLAHLGPMSDPYIFLRPDPELEAAAHDGPIFPPE